MSIYVKFTAISPIDLTKTKKCATNIFAKQYFYIILIFEYFFFAKNARSILVYSYIRKHLDFVWRQIKELCIFYARLYAIPCIADRAFFNLRRFYKWEKLISTQFQI